MSVEVDAVALYGVVWGGDGEPDDGEGRPLVRLLQRDDRAAVTRRLRTLHHLQAGDESEGYTIRNNMCYKGI